MAHAWDLIIIHLQEGWLFGGRYTLKRQHIDHEQETEINLDKTQGCIKGDRQIKIISVPKGDVKIKGKTILWKTALRGITQTLSLKALKSHIIMLDK